MENNMEADMKLYGDICSVLNVKNKSNKLLKILNKYTVSDISTNLSIKKLCDIFIDAKRVEGLSKITIRNYIESMKKFQEYFNKKDINSITKNDMRNFISNLEKSISQSSIYLHLNVIKSFYEFLNNEEYIFINPMKGLNYKHVKNSRKAISENDQEKLIKACNTLFEKTLISFFLCTGCRLTEVSSLKLDNIDFDKNTIEIIGKGNKTRTVLFDNKTKTLMKKLIKECSDGEYLFCHNFNGKVIHSNNSILTKTIKRIASRTNIKYSIHPHLFRHTFATNCLKKGMNITSIQKLLGHSDLSTTQIYAETDLDLVKKGYNKVFKWEMLIDYIVNYCLSLT